MPRFTLALLVLVLSLAATPRVASAGCLSSGTGGCDMAMDATAVFVGGPSCLTITVEENDCVCATDLVITNTCDDGTGSGSPGLVLEAIDFEWCGRQTCTTTIQKGETSGLSLPLAGAEALGDHEIMLLTRLGTTSLPLRVNYRMENVTYDTGCSATSGGTALAGPALLLLALLRRRARRATPL